MTEMISPVRLISSRRFGDARGWFSETYSEAAFARMGINVRFVQDNHSMSSMIGTIRGIHFQAPPFAQGKLVRCLKGSVRDYAVDLRRGSPTYGRWVSALLSAGNGDQLYIPTGFGHAFETLEPETEITYKVSAPYAPSHDGGVVWSDPDIGIEWATATPYLSDKDRDLPLLAELESPFDYDGAPLQPIIQDHS